MKTLTKENTKKTISIRETMRPVFSLPDDYEQFASENNYLKLGIGENRIRIVGNLVCGWEDWVEDGEKKKPVRFRLHDKPSTSSGGKIKLFWSMPVWNYALAKIQVFHITQVSIITALKRLLNEAEWGDPSRYDLKILREGEGINTVYSVVPVPPTPFSNVIKDALQKISINLDALFSNEDPFHKSGE